MGYALFTARKLSVTARLNQCNAQLMSNTEQTFNVTASIYAKQNASSLKATQASKKAYQTYADAIQNNGDQTAAKAALDAKLQEIAEQTAMDDIEIQELNAQQTQLDLEKKNLETQLNAFQNELDNVSKAEENAIKNSTPSYK